MRPSSAAAALRQVADAAGPVPTRAWSSPPSRKCRPLKNKKGEHGHAVKRQHGFFAGNARITVLQAVTGAELGA
jgi:hypothetical protein